MRLQFELTGNFVVLEKSLNNGEIKYLLLPFVEYQTIY